jgi:hypothetical protein
MISNGFRRFRERPSFKLCHGLPAETQLMIKNGDNLVPFQYSIMVEKSIRQFEKKCHINKTDREYSFP